MTEQSSSPKGTPLSPAQLKTSIALILGEDEYTPPRKGRPRKTPEGAEEPKRPRGRPRKEVDPNTPKRGRGRPRLRPRLGDEIPRPELRGEDEKPNVPPAVLKEARQKKDKAMGSLGYDRMNEDFYPTEPWVTKTLLNNWDFPPGDIWECACGEGDMAEVLKATGRTVHATDLMDRGYGSPGVDYLEETVALRFPKVRAIITNPPYLNGMPERFAEKAIEQMADVKGDVALLMRHEWDAAKARTQLMHHPAFAMKLVLTRRPRWIRDSLGQPRHPYAWYVWSWSTVGKPPTIKWDSLDH